MDKHNTYIPPIPGMIKDGDDSRTNLLTVLGVTVPALQIGAYNDGRSVPPVATVQIDGKEYSLKAIMEAYKNAERDVPAAPFDIENPVALTHPRAGSTLAVTSLITPMQHGSGTPSPTNVREINARKTDVTLTRRGKNLFKPTAGTDKGITFAVTDDNGVSVTGTSIAAYASVNSPTFDAIPFRGKFLTLSATGHTSDVYPQITIYDVNNTLLLITGCNNNKKSTTAFVPYTATRFYVSVTVPTSGTAVNVTIYPQLELGDVATAFEPYMDDVYTRQLGLTVNGGKLDWRTGVLTIDRAQVAFNGTENWTLRTDLNYSVTGLFFYIPSGEFTYAAANTSDNPYPIVCSHLAYAGNFGATADDNHDAIALGNAQYFTGNLIVRRKNDAFTGTNEEKLAAFKAWLAEEYAAGHPVTAVYQRKTTLTAQLTAQEITALTGINVLTSDTGDTRVTGKLDPAWERIERTPPHNYLYDGADLSLRYTPDQLSAALANEDYRFIRVGDYYPAALNGTFRDYGSYTVPSGTTYYSDNALTTSAGTTSAALEGAYENATAVKCYANHADVYVAKSDCLDYFERTCTNVILKCEIAGIDHYWRYGDSGDLSTGKSHLAMITRDCLPFYLRMRKANSVLEDTDATNPWLGSALFKTLNDPDYGIVKLIEATPIGAYIYGGASDGGMRAMLETTAPGASAASSWAWADRGKLWLPSEREIWGQRIWSEVYYGAGLTPQFEIFRDGTRHVSKGIGNGGSRYGWWSLSSYSSTHFCIVNYYGIQSNSYAVSAYGVPVCFIFV